jgi:predicted ATPase
MRYTSPRFSSHEFNFDRVTVILGANGSGKSKLLGEIRDAVPQSSPGAKAVFIEGGRTITLTDVLQLDAKNFSQFDRLESAVAQYEKKRSRSLASRVFDALVVLEKRELQIKSAHSDEVEQWAASDRQGEYPKRKLAPLARLFELFRPPNHHRRRARAKPTS